MYALTIRGKDQLHYGGHYIGKPHRDDDKAGTVPSNDGLDQYAVYQHADYEHTRRHRQNQIIRIKCGHALHEQRYIHAEHQKFALRKIDYLHNAKYQRKAHRDQCIDASHCEPIEQ